MPALPILQFSIHSSGLNLDNSSQGGDRDDNELVEGLHR